MSPTFQIFLFVALAICYVAWDVQALSIPRQHIPASCNDLHHCRTIWNIIWNSIATIFSCTWVAVHPNIPDPNLKAKFWRHRLKLMAITLTVPELVVIWAMRQWLTVHQASASQAERGAFCFYYCKSNAKVRFRSSAFENYAIFCPYGRSYG